jgi:hypothetical protein
MCAQNTKGVAGAAVCASTAAKSRLPHYGVGRILDCVDKARENKALGDCVATQPDRLEVLG